MRGRIEHRGKSWRIVVDVGRDAATGRRIQHTQTFRVRKDAERRLAELIQQANTGGLWKAAVGTGKGDYPPGPCCTCTASFARPWATPSSGAWWRAT